MVKFSQIMQEAAEAPDEGERWSPPQDAVLTVKAVDVRSKEAKGMPRWSLWLEVQNGEFEGKRFWTTLFITAHAGVNKRVIKNLMAFGVTESFLASDPTTDLIGAALKDRYAKVTVGYRKDKEKKNDDGTPVMWDNHSFESLGVQSEVEAVIVTTDDDDDDWDDD